MSGKVQILRSLVEQRLTAATEEIFGLFEKTIEEYEEELCRTKEENQRQKQILDTVLLHTPSSSDTHQQSFIKEEVPPKQKQWSPSVDLDQNQEDSEDHHIKEEQEELWIYQEADIIKFPSTSVPVKNEDEEKAQSSQLHQRQTKKNQEETDVEDCEGSGPASSLDPHRHVQSVSDNSSKSSETEDSDCDWTETHRTQSGSESGQTIKLVKTDNGLLTKERPFPCSYCGKRFMKKGTLSRHMRYHTGEKPFTCSDCGKSFTNRQSLTMHMRCHTGEQPFSCSECGKSFSGRGNVNRHMRIHTGEKPFTCSVCTKSFHVRDQLNRHMKCHTGEKPFSCNICGKRSAAKGDLTRHMRIHTREKPFSCSVCGKSFAETGHLKRHMKLHTND